MPFKIPSCNDFFIEFFRGSKLLNNDQYPKLLLPIIVVRGYLGALSQSITLLGAQHDMLSSSLIDSNVILM